MELTEKKPKVSVCVVTYNQEKYIGQCLQSIVDQETDFDFEVIVGDDCSTDNTKVIVQEFAEKYPLIIKLMFYEINIGAAKNYLSVHGAARGKYIAHMDGDDYALPGKLQIQSDYLEQNPKCNIVWHRMLIVNDATGVIAEDLIDSEKISKNGFSRADILRFVTIGMNSSKMYRSNVRAIELPEFPVVDFFVNVEQIGAGVANFTSNKPLGGYRAGIGVASSGNTTKVLLRKSFLFFLNKYPEYKKDIGTAVLILFLAELKNRRWANCLIYAKPLVRSVRLSSVIDLWNHRKIFPMLRFPRSVRKDGG